MRAPRYLLVAVSGLAMSVAGLYAQSVISAHSGVLHYFEGDLTLDGQAPHPRAGTFAEVKEKQALETQVGRAEVLLTPGVFLRIGENSGIRMVSNKLTDTQVEFLKGSVIVDFVEVAKDNQVTMNYQDYKITFVKKGIYRFDSEPSEFKVYTGEAIVSHGSSNVNLKDGRAVPFTPALVSEKFDNRTGDALYRWAKRRSEYIAVANLSAARKAGSSFNSGASGWYYNPYYSMFTFIPSRGYMCDPFATFMSLYPSYGCYYSPMGAYNYFAQPNYYGGGGYYNPVSNHTSAGYYPTSIGTSSTLSSYSNNSTYSPGPSVASPSSSSSAVSSAPSFSGASPSSGGGFSGGGGGGASHGGGSAGGHGR